MNSKFGDHGGLIAVELRLRNDKAAESQSIRVNNQRSAGKRGNRGKSVGKHVPRAPNANDQIGNGTKNIGADANQAGRMRALT